MMAGIMHVDVLDVMNDFKRRCRRGRSALRGAMTQPADKPFSIEMRLRQRP
jgi:hypothetical protein